MGTLRELFEQREIIISLRNDNEGPDWSSFLTVQYIIDNQDIFGNFFLQYPLNGINNEDDFYLYLLISKIASLRLTIPRLKQDEHKIIIEKISTEADAVLKKTNIGLVIKYINHNYKDLLDKKGTDHDLRDRTADIIGQYSSNGISKSVLDYIAANDGYMVIDRFEDFEKAMEKDNDIFQKLFPTGRLSEFDVFRTNETLNIWAYILNKEKSSLKELVIDRVDVLYNDVIEYANSITREDVLQKEGLVREFNNFLKKTSNPKANAFETINGQIQEMLAAELEENGQSFSYEIPVEKMLEKWKEKEPWIARILMLTCTVKDNGGERTLDSRLNSKTEKTSLIDFVSSNIPRDDFFTSSHQQWLSLSENVSGALIAGLLQKNETATDFFNILASIASYYGDLTNSKKEGLQQDIDMLINMLRLISELKKVDKTIVQTQCYGAAMFACALIEKVMRIAYQRIAKNDKYIPIEKATLGEMLSTNNPYFVAIFGEYHLKNLSYYLTHIPPEKIGRNYRNALAHWADITVDTLEPFLVYKLLWLLCDVMVTLILFFERQRSKEQKEDD